ncbi:MAG TPA: ATPase [Anaerolineae bacterium]|nr:ATPase [Anaerolineae bacterium]
MMSQEKNIKKIVVTGDVTMDWNLARDLSERGERWRIDRCSRIWWQRGGAALQADLIEALATSTPDKDQISYRIYQPATPMDPVQHGDPRYHHSYALWSPFKSGDRTVWRVAQYLGIDHCLWDESSEEDQTLRVVDDPTEVDIVVLDDAGLGFRDRPALWPKSLQNREQKPWVILKMSKPVAEGPLWDHLFEAYAKNLIIVTTIADLRQTEVQISRQVSWERTAQDIYWELTHNPRVNNLSRCAHVIVSFHTAGAVLLSHSQAVEKKALLFFDPHNLEGDWERKHPGGMFGYTSCLITSLIRQLMLNRSQPELGNGIRSGIAAMRKLHLDGYGHPGSDPKTAELRFPIDKVISEIEEGETPLTVAPIQDPVRNILSPTDPGSLQVMPGFWTILEDRYTGALTDVAQRIVLDGIDAALEGIPIGKFGALVTVDRREIEALHSIRSLITEFCERPPKRPLSIAVFGPPGSGKSFGVTQIAKSSRPGEIQPISFNISQFGHSEELLGALHQVRDIGLSGKIPLVFWDEFDTPLGDKHLGWLRYFLAPMQDGAFQEGQITHPIGRAIFVFAGGTSHRMEEFGAELDETERRAVKLPDFISRLKGFLNVLGPNPIARPIDEGTGEPIPDPYFIIRRAIILRVLFELNVPQIIRPQEGVRRVHIDHGILQAFLETNRYKHGVRSMESILHMSLLAGATAFERSNLPPEDQLNLHVDGRDFLARVQQMKLEGTLLEKLAEAAHEIFCEELREKGFHYGPQTDTTEKTHSSLKPYQDLPENEKDSNRDNVRDIANKLAAVGYLMVPARSNEPPFDFPGDDLEFLAELEHQRWMTEKVNAGWRHSPKTEKEQKLHSALVEWDELPEEEREKDRILIQQIPEILAKAGYAILKS